MNKIEYVLAVENSDGRLDYSRENFARLNPHISDTVDNWYHWRMAVSQSRLRQLNAQIRFEVQREEKPF